MSNRNKNTDEAVHAGDWWVKGKRNKRAKGTLHLPAKGRFKLEVHGNLGTAAGSNPSVIFGSTLAGKEFTLFNNANSGFTSGFGGCLRSFAPQIILENAHVADLVVLG